MASTAKRTPGTKIGKFRQLGTGLMLGTLALIGGCGGSGDEDAPITPQSTADRFPYDGRWSRCEPLGTGASRRLTLEIGGGIQEVSASAFSSPDCSGPELFNLSLPPARIKDVWFRTVTLDGKSASASTVEITAPAGFPTTTTPGATLSAGPDGEVRVSLPGLSPIDSGLPAYVTETVIRDLMLVSGGRLYLGNDQLDPTGYPMGVDPASVMDRY